MRKLVIIGICSLLAACGGGGGGGGSAGTAASATSTVTALLDSFGQVVGAMDGFGGADSGGDAGGDGTAADGAPIPNALVTVQDATGKVATAITDAKGYYRVKITGFTGPLIAYVVKADGTKRYSLSVQSPVVGKFITMNLSGLTDKIASDIAIAAGKTRSSDMTPAMVAANAKLVDTSIAAMRVSLAAAIQNAGLSVTTFDPLRTPFLANHTGYDNVLDNTVVTIAPSGATQITQATVLTPPATNASSSTTSNTSSTSSTSSTSPTAVVRYSLWNPTNFTTPATVNATVTTNGANSSIVFTTPAVSLSTVDSWNTGTWSGTVGNFNQAKADGNFLRICTAETNAGTSIAVSEKMTTVDASTAAGRRGLANRVFLKQDCTGSSIKTWTFNADGSQFASSDAPTTFYPISLLDQLFSPTGYFDTGVTPNQRTWAKAYSITYPAGTAYFLVILNTTGTTNIVGTAIGQ